MLKRLPPGLRQLNTFPFYYEVSVWLICVCTYKYSYLLDVSDLPNPQFDNFPHPQLILFAIGLSLYTIPFYRWLVPTLLKKKKNGWLPVAIILYFGLVCGRATGSYRTFSITSPRILPSRIFTRNVLQ